MIKRQDQLKVRTKYNTQGDVKITLTDLEDLEGKNPKLRMFSHARLRPGEEVTYHTHENECESYYILSGTGLYNDNGEQIQVGPGTATLTISGQGHGLKNTGSEMLEFIALILLD